MSDILDLETIHEMIKKRYEEFGSQAAYARHLGILPQQLNRCINGHATMDPSVLRDLGLERKTVYCKKGTTDD